MRWLVGAAMVAGLGLIGSLAGIDRANAAIVVVINKSKQRMTVLVDGLQQHVWKISTGLRGGPPSGTYHPERLERKWFSHKYGWSPMPHSIFFYKGYAIHGTYYVSRLGKKASHGCVRLLPAHAATLFDLVRSRGKASTTIIVSNSDLAVQPDALRKVDEAMPTGSTHGPAAAPAKDAASEMNEAPPPSSAPDSAPDAED